MTDLSKKISKVQPSPTLAISAQAKMMKKRGEDVVGFGAGEPDFDTPGHIKDAAIEAIRSGLTKYTPASGTLELKKAIGEKFQRDNGLEYDPAEIIVSCGAKHVLYNIFQAICNDGDNVIVVAPYWVSYPEMLTLAGAEANLVSTLEGNNFMPDPALIAKAVNNRTRAIIINSPNNPTGSVYDRRVLEEIAAIAVDKDILIISDEVYEKMLYDGARHFSIAGLGKEVRTHTITVNAASKTYAMTGWRIGYAGGPQGIIGAMSRLQSHSTSNPNSIAQQAVIKALISDQQCVDRMVAEFSRRRDFAITRLREIKGLTFAVPRGAFYFMLNVSAFLKTLYENTIELAGDLLEKEKVAIVPGEGFGAPGYLRMSFAASEKDIEKGITRIKRFLELI